MEVRAGEKRADGHGWETGEVGTVKGRTGVKRPHGAARSAGKRRHGTDRREGKTKWKGGGGKNERGNNMIEMQKKHGNREKY